MSKSDVPVPCPQCNETIAVGDGVEIGGRLWCTQKCWRSMMDGKAISPVIDMHGQSGFVVASGEGGLIQEDAEKATGLYDKYIVKRSNGSSEPGGKHESCKYFVLDLVHDKLARPALEAYAIAAHDAGYKKLAADLASLSGTLPRVPGSPDAFLREWYRMGELMRVTSESKGFWREGQKRNQAEMIALMHSELSEALEGIRHGNPASDHIPEFTAVEEEMADTVIRIMDFCAGFGHRVAEAIVAKQAFNAGRPAMHGGKKF